MSKASDVLYGRRGGRMAPGTHDRAEEALATVARERAKARKAHAAGGDPWPGDVPAAAELGHPEAIARQIGRRRELAARWPDGLPAKGSAGYYAARDHLDRLPVDPADLADAWLQRARMAAARRAAGVHLDPTDLEALERHPNPPGILELANRHRKAPT